MFIRVKIDHGSVKSVDGTNGRSAGLHRGAQSSEEETSDMATSEDVENIKRSVDLSSWGESQSRVKA